MSRGKHFTDEQKAEIRQRAAAGENQSAIARAMKISQPGVGRILKAGDAASTHPDLVESDAFLDAVKRLEKKFPGAIQKIQAGYVKFKPKREQF